MYIYILHIYIYNVGIPIITPPHFFFGGGDIFCGVSQYCGPHKGPLDLACCGQVAQAWEIVCVYHRGAPKQRWPTSEGSEGLKVCFGVRSLEFHECDDMIISIWLHDVYVNVYFFAGIFSQSSSVDCISISKESSIMRFMMSHDFFNQIYERRFHSWQAHTPWKFNIDPENRPFQKETHLPTIVFQGLC